DAEARRQSASEFISSAVSKRTGIVQLSALNAGWCADGPDFGAAREHAWGDVLDLVHVMAESKSAAQPQLWLVTCGAQAVDEQNSSRVSLAQSPLWGLGRVIAV